MVGTKVVYTENLVGIKHNKDVSGEFPNAIVNHTCTKTVTDGANQILSSNPLNS